MLSQAVTELENKLLKLSNISYNSIDSLMRKIMKLYKVTAKDLHNAFKFKNKKTPDDWIKGKMKKLQEDHKEIASGEKKDNEGYMARNELNSIEKAIKNLRKSIKSGNQQLPAWVQSKITKAADYIDTASEYLESDEKVDEEISPIINTDKHKKARTEERINKLTKSPNPNEARVAKSKSKGPSLPFKEEISLVEKILGEEKCGKGMYWCNTDKKCKPLPEGMKVSGQKIKPTEVGIGKPVAEGSCNHTHKGNTCPVHGEDECPEQTSESNIVRDANGNVYAEFIDIIRSGSIEEENPCWAGYKKVGTKKKGNRMVNDCVPEETNLVDEIINEKCWKGYKKKGMKTMFGKKYPNCVPVKEANIDEAVRLPAQTGNNIFVTLSWRGKYYTMQLFFPQAKIPSRIEISDEMQKIYPGSRVVTYRVADFKPGEPILYAYRGGDAGKLGPNKNYVKPMGEQREIEPPKEKVGALTNIDIPSNEREAARQRTLDKAAAKRREREMKEEVEKKVETPPSTQGELIKKAKIATKRNDTNIDGFVDDKDGKTGPYGAFIPSVDGKGKLYTDLNVKNEDWQKVNRQDKTDGLSQKAVNAYKKENPGSKLKTAVTEKNPGGKRAKRRSSFCSRMSGMKSKLTSAKTARDPNSRINKALRRWRCN